MNNQPGRFQLDEQTPVSIEPFVSDDLDAICAIERRTHAFPWQHAHFADSLKASHHHCLGARLHEQWLGYAIVSCIAGEAELLLLVVDTPWQGRGIASQLLNHLIQCLHGQADTLFLEVSAGNSRAIDLYEALAFNQVGIRPNYYQSPGHTEDALILARTLN